MRECKEPTLVKCGPVSNVFVRAIDILYAFRSNFVADQLNTHGCNEIDPAHPHNKLCRLDHDLVAQRIDICPTTILCRIDETIRLYLMKFRWLNLMCVPSSLRMIESVLLLPCF